MKSVLIAMTIMFTAACFPAHAQERPKAADPVKVPRELLEKRVESARKVFEFKRAKFTQAGQGDPLDWIVWSRRIMDAELALHLAADRSDANVRIKTY